MADERPSKRSKTNHPQRSNGGQQAGKWKNHKVQTKRGQSGISSSGIHNDDVGVFVTCNKGQERRCLDEVKDLFAQYLEGDLKRDGGGGAKEYNSGDSDDRTEYIMTNSSDPDGRHFTSENSGGGGDRQDNVVVNDDIGTQQYTAKHNNDDHRQYTPTNDEDDVEADIEAELSALRNKSITDHQLKLITLDVPCVCFVNTGQHNDPVRLVHQICSDAYANPRHKRGRYIQRMTPMSLMRKTLSGGLEDVCRSVLPPHFGAGRPSKKFAIRPTIRNNHDLDRETVIKTVARAVGDGHRVDLKNYDLLILVDVYRNVCGMSVVGNDYEMLKRYNLAEIYSPTPKPGLEGVKQTKKDGQPSTGQDVKGDAAVPTVPPDENTPQSQEAKSGGDVNSDTPPDTSAP